MVQLQPVGQARLDITSTTAGTTAAAQLQHTLFIQPVRAGAGKFMANPRLGCSVTLQQAANASSAASTSNCTWSSSNSSYLAPLQAPAAGNWSVAVQLWHPDSPAVFNVTRSFVLTAALPLAVASASGMSLIYNGSRVGDPLYAVLRLKDGMGMPALGVANVALTVS